MGRMKEIYMEVYQKFGGEVPYDMTVAEFVAQAEQYKKEQELEELKYEQEIKRSKGKETFPEAEEG